MSTFGYKTPTSNAGRYTTLATNAGALTQAAATLVQVTDGQIFDLGVAGSYKVPAGLPVGTSFKVHYSAASVLTGVGVSAGEELRGVIYALDMSNPAAAAAVVIPADDDTMVTTANTITAGSFVNFTKVSSTVWYIEGMTSAVPTAFVIVNAAGA